MSKIVFFEVEEWEKEFFQQTFAGEELLFFPNTTDQYKEGNGNIYDADVLSIFVFSQLTQEVLSKFTQLKFITTRSTGYDHIDIRYCESKGIIVSNVPSYGVHTVAEHTIALMLSLSRRIVPSVDRTRKGDFSLEGLTGLELFNKTLGVVGAGNIGKVVIQIALGIGMQVLVYSRHVDEDIAKFGNVRFVELNELLNTSDVVSVHLPLNSETKHLINTENISQMKKGSLLINAARGGIIETEAIVKGLQEKILFGVGLDVLEEECTIREERELLSKDFFKTCDLHTQLLNHMLLQQENVIITPHNAFNSSEALRQILETTIGNIREFVLGTSQHVVTKVPKTN